MCATLIERPPAFSDDVRRLPATPPSPQKRPSFTTCKTLCMRRNESGQRNRNMSRLGVVCGGSGRFRPLLRPCLEYRGAGAQRRDWYESPAAPCGFLNLSRSTLFPYSWRLDSNFHVPDDIDIFMYPVPMLPLPQVVFFCLVSIGSITLLSDLDDDEGRNLTSNHLRSLPSENHLLLWTVRWNDISILGVARNCLVFAAYIVLTLDTQHALKTYMCFTTKLFVDCDVDQSHVYLGNVNY